MLRPLFTITIFTSAFLLFLVQPMVGKLILPKLGGTPQVWNTCMVFFQMALLAGYGYTHVLTTKLKLRQILVLHCGMLLIPIAMLFLFPMYKEVHSWSPPTQGTPVGNTLGVLALIIGIPFLLASTSAPILIRWFAYSGDPAAKDPYFLYAVSNMGSLSALFFYPALEEPFVDLPTQTYVWVGGFITLSLLIGCCALSIFKVAPPDEQLAAEAAASAPPPETPAPESPVQAPAPAPVVDASTAVKSGHAPAARGIQRKKGMKVPGRADDEHDIHRPEFDANRGAKADMTWARRIRWVLLAAVPSSLMLGVTSYISTDLSPFPLVWIIPLALYLISFILVYLKGWTGHRLPIGGGGYTLHQIVVYVAQPIGVLCLCIIVLRRGFDPFYATSAAMLGFFANALACHGELAEDRPSTKHLTEYFLLMSVGGAVGGILNGIIAPLLFQSGVLEFYIAIVIACFVRPQYVPSGWFDELVLSAFPGLRGWFSNQGDEMAKSLGRPAPRTTYMFSLFLDILFGAFILSISYYLKVRVYEGEWFGKLLRFIGMDPRNTFGYSLIVFGPPILFCFFFAGRPLRFGLAVFGLLFGSLYLAEQDRDDALVPGGARRTYFGVLRVMKGTEKVKDEEEQAFFTEKRWITKEGEIQPQYMFHYLMHGTTYHGRNYLYDPTSEMGKHFKDISRLATTYYHRYGPVGAVMERDNWFPGPQNSFYADNRMPTSIVGQIAAGIGSGGLPLPALVETWSEPPFATIGLGTGTMVSYARPFQHMTYYEIDEVIREFSLPQNPADDGHFTYLQSAIRRGVNLEVIMGDARQSLAREEANLDTAFVYSADFSKNLSKLKGRTYANVPYNVVNRKLEKGKDKDGKEIEVNKSTNRENYYRAINVDAFSSDAIPVHLVTEQAIALYMSKMSENGVLCVHTSNRHMDLVRPVARIALALKLGCIVGKDRMDKERYMGHFSSEYVMIFRKNEPEGKDKDKPDLTFAKYVEDLQDEKEKLAGAPVPNGRQILNSDVLWYDPYKDHTEVQRGRLVKRPITLADSLWTDDYSFILGVLR